MGLRNPGIRTVEFDRSKVYSLAALHEEDYDVFLDVVPRDMMVEKMDTYGADSFVGRVASVLQGSTETTFYVLALYFGAVNIKNTRYAVVCGLIADFAGIIAAILLSYMFFH